MALTPQTSSRSFLEIDGSLGMMNAFGGLGFDADIAVSRLATQVQRKKSVANVRFTPGQARVGLGMGRGLYKWVKSALDQSITPRSGIVKQADFNYKVQSQLSFFDAILTSFTVPKLDGSSRESGLFDLGFEVGRVTPGKGDGSDIRGKIEPATKNWLSSNFKIAIGNLPCARVASVDAFTWRCVLPAPTAQGERDPTAGLGEVVVPNLKLHISLADYPAWMDAATKWFIGGQRLEGDEMRGRISLLGPDMIEELAWIDLYNVGFKSFAHEDGMQQADDVRRFAVELYVERMALNVAAYGT
jgi:hypothetical protein